VSKAAKNACTTGFRTSTFCCFKAAQYLAR
jgi:hypothetical protein